MGKAHILVVDDDPAVRQLAVMALRNAGHKVSEASSGEEALGKCVNDTYSLIVLDNSMPGMKGPEVAQKLRGYAPTQHTPIVMLSGLDSDSDQWDGWRAGVDLYVTKPFDDDVLAAQVRRLLLKAAMSS